MSQNIEYSVENPEGSQQERLWRSVLMDYPYYEGSRTLQSAFVRAGMAEGFARGRLTKGALIENYISRWILAGFSPELYWVVSSGIQNAAIHARRRCQDPEDLLRMEDRMHLLGVYAPNPKAGQSYLAVEKFDEKTGEPIGKLHQHPDYIVQLVPEAWAGFPQRLQFARPSVALQQFIYGDVREGADG